MGVETHCEGWEVVVVEAEERRRGSEVDGVLGDGRGSGESGKVGTAVAIEVADGQSRDVNAIGQGKCGRRAGKGTVADTKVNEYRVI